MNDDPSRIERCFDREYRFSRLNMLRLELGLRPVEMGVCEAASLPSVGIEIEMTWRQAFADMSEWQDTSRRPRDLTLNSPEYEEFNEKYDKNDRRLRPLLEHIAHIIPRVGVDAYWEFSFLPVKDLSVLAAELATLFELDVLRSDQEYATHLTVAGIRHPRDAFAVMVACELAGGTTRARLNAPLESEKGAWSRRHDVDGGLRRRAAHELYGSDQAGYELRTMVTTSVDQIMAVVELAQELAGLMTTDPDRWEGVRAEIESQLKAGGLPLSSWGNPRERPEIWQKYMRLVSSRQAD